MGPGASEDTGQDAAQEAYAAELLTGFGLAIGDGAAEGFRRALEVFARAALIDETRPEAYLGMGLCAANLGDEERALRYFDLCLEHGFGAGDFATLSYELDDEGGSTLTYDIALDDVLIWRGACQLALGWPEAARCELLRISDAPANELRSMLAALRGSICLASDELDAAQRHLGEALAWDREDPDAHFLRGSLHERRGDPAAALKAYARAIALDPDETDFRIARAALLIDAGDADGAAGHLAAAERIVAAQLPQPGRSRRIAELLERFERPDD